MEDIVVIESKDYAQVVFDEVNENYSENQPIECSFHLNELLKVDTSDWIGIYKVGFVNCKDFVCRQYINFELVKENKGKIHFEGENLPKDDGEFYQFVYVSQSKQIRGASIPFQFKKAHLSDYIEIEEQEAIIYKSKESAINETLTEIKSRCNHLAQANDTYERLIKENEDIIKCLKEEVSSVKHRCLRLTIDNEKLNNTLKSKADNLKNLADTISNLTNENNKLQDKFESLTTENRNLLDSLQIRIEQIENLKNELETVKMSKEQFESILNIKEDELNQLRKDKDELNRIAEDLQRINDQIVKLEKQVDERVEELTKIKNELKRNEAIVLEQTQTIQKILHERDNLNNLIQKLVKEKSDLVCSQENLSQELNMSRDKLMAAEQCKEMLRAQLVVITDELNEANAKLAKQIGTINDLQQREKHFEEEKRQWHEKLEKQKAEYELKLEESNGSYFALKLAHTHLETRLRNMDASKTKSDKDIEQLKIQFEKIKEENEDLKERIKAGAKEYSKLFDRYRLIKNQQFNYDMNVYHDLNGNVLLRNRLNGADTRYVNKYDSSSSSSEHQFESDSAIQDKTMSQSARASTEDVDNTLLDAFLGSGLYNLRNEYNLNNLQRELSTSTQLSGKNQKTPAIIQTPLVETSSSSSTSSDNKNEIPVLVVKPSDNLSDDGLTTPNSEIVAISSTTSSTTTTAATANADDADAEGNINVTDSLNLLRIDLKKKSTQEQFSNCDVCNFIFPSNANVNDIEKHYELHFGPSCPICFLSFRKGYPQGEFENHVNSHFSN